MEIDFRKKRYVLDGGMGTMLQSAGMSPEETTTEFGLAHPEILTQIHKKLLSPSIWALWENFLSLWERCLLKMHTMHSAR